MLPLLGCSSQFALGTCDWRSFMSAALRSSENVISTSPDVNASRRVERLAMTLPLDGVEVGAALAPISVVAHHLRRSVAVELDELERAGSDRLGPHARRETWQG